MSGETRTWTLTNRADTPSELPFAQGAMLLAGESVEVVEVSALRELEAENERLKAEVRGTEQAYRILVSDRTAERDEARAERDDLQRQLGRANGKCDTIEEAFLQARAELAQLREIGAWFLRLKDGPRDKTYHREKPQAWDRLRAALSEAGE